MMAKQTFTTGQVLTAAQMTSLQQTAMLGGAANAKVASYVLVAADAGDAITMSNASATTITVNTGLFAAGDIVTIINLGAGVCTITAGTATVTTSGSLALAQNQGGVLRFTSASAAIFFQFATPASGDIEGVTAGTGISGGGTSGTVTITNSMATEITAKGDLIVGTGNAAFDNLPVGTNGHILVADSSVSPTGLKWAAPAAGGGMTLIETLTLSGSSVTSSTLPTSYKNLYIEAIDYSASTAAMIFMRPNNESGSDYTTFSVRFQTSGSNFGPSGSGTATSIPLLDPNDIGMDTTADGNISVANIYRYNDTNTYKLCNVFNHITNSSAVKGTTNLVGTLRKEAAITTLTIGTGAGTFSSGTVRIYGVN